MSAQHQNSANIDISSDVETEGHSAQGKTVTVNNISDEQLRAFKPVITALLEQNVLQTYRWTENVLTLTFDKDSE